MTALMDETRVAEPASGPRIDYHHLAPAALRAQLGIETYVRGSGLEKSLLHLVKIRASYLNGCGYCVDMHTKEARLDNESEQRLYALPMWHETPFYTARERAALEWTDAVTRLGEAHVPDAAFDEVRRHFTDIEIVNLTMAIVAINGWNRLAIAFRVPVGSYEPQRR
jgi:AhpD family alkylhydroperoxidase